jgi:hypothetical protein
MAFGMVSLVYNMGGTNNYVFIWHVSKVHMKCNLFIYLFAFKGFIISQWMQIMLNGRMARLEQWSFDEGCSNENCNVVH